MFFEYKDVQAKLYIGVREELTESIQGRKDNVSWQKAKKFLPHFRVHDRTCEESGHFDNPIKDSGGHILRHLCQFLNPEQM